jgi:hypothetical protein
MHAFNCLRLSDNEREISLNYFPRKKSGSAHSQLRHKLKYISSVCSLFTRLASCLNLTSFLLTSAKKREFSERVRKTLPRNTRNVVEKTCLLVNNTPICISNCAPKVSRTFELLINNSWKNDQLVVHLNVTENG